jgi:hypothetical protein
MYTNTDVMALMVLLFFPCYQHGRAKWYYEEGLWYSYLGVKEKGV